MQTQPRRHECISHPPHISEWRNPASSISRGLSRALSSDGALHREGSAAAHRSHRLDQAPRSGSLAIPRVAPTQPSASNDRKRIRRRSHSPSLPIHLPVNPSAAAWSEGRCPSAGPLEKLDFLLVLRGRLPRLECPQIAPLSRLRIFLARVQSILARSQFADHPNTSTQPTQSAPPLFRVLSLDHIDLMQREGVEQVVHEE